MKTVDVLIKAREILSNPAHWTKGSLRKRFNDGTECFCSNGGLAQAVGLLQLVPNEPCPIRNYHCQWVSSPEAVAMALSGLTGPGYDMRRVSNEFKPQVATFLRAQKYLQASINVLYPVDGWTVDVFNFNDVSDTTHDMVMNVFEHAIRCAKRRHIAKKVGKK